MSFIILAAYVALAMPPSWSDPPRPPMSWSSSKPSYGSKSQLSRLPMPTVSMWESMAMIFSPSPMKPMTLPRPSTLTSSKPSFSISALMQATTSPSSQDSLG